MGDSRSLGSWRAFFVRVWAFVMGIPIHLSNFRESWSSVSFVNPRLGKPPMHGLDGICRRTRRCFDALTTSVSEPGGLAIVSLTYFLGSALASTAVLLRIHACATRLLGSAPLLPTV